MERENGRAGAQDVFDSERGGSCGGGLRLQALQEADKHLQIPDHPQRPSQQVASCKSSGLSAASWGLSGLHLTGSQKLLGLK